MRLMYFFWATSASLLAVASLAVVDADINLTAETFEASIATEPLMLVRFAFSFRQIPCYEEAGIFLKENNVKFANVDCAEEVELCQSNDIQYYPTLRLYESGTLVDTSFYGGIVSYITKQSLPEVSEITSADHENFTKINKIVVIAYLPSSDSDAAFVFGAAAEVYYNYCVFGLSYDPANAAAANVTPPAIVAYRTFDEPRTEFPLPIPGFGIEDIGDWIDELLVPAIDALHDNFDIYLNSGKPLVMLLLDPTSEGHDRLMEALRPIAREFKPEVDFVWVNATKLSLCQQKLEPNLPGAGWPGFVITDYEQRPVYQSNEVTPELVSLGIEQFLNLNEEFEPLLRSAPIPEYQNESVYVVVGINFEEVVFDDSKDIFIEFYSLWCDHFKDLEPTWNSLGDRFAPLKDKITIAKMDIMQNELPPSVPFRLRRLPALKFKPAGTRDFIDYDGDRSLQSLITFVEEHSKNSLTAGDDAGAVQVPMSASGPL